MFGFLTFSLISPPVQLDPHPADHLEDLVPRSANISLSKPQRNLPNKRRNYLASKQNETISKFRKLS